MLRYLKHYWKSILWLLIIFYLSAFKFVFLKKISPQLNADKWGHFVMYFIFSFVLFYDYTMNTETRKTSTLISWAFVFPLFFGGLMELIQYFFISYRTGSWLDMLANFVGILTAFLLSYFLLFRKIYLSSAEK